MLHSKLRNMLKDISNEDKQFIYNWLNELQIQRQTQFINRDFSDGVLLAKVIKLYMPKLIELHNYQDAVGQTKKLENWQTLQNKVLSKMKIKLDQKELSDLSQSKPGVIEKLLFVVYQQIQLYKGMQDKQDMAEEQSAPAPPRKRGAEPDLYESMQDAKSQQSRMGTSPRLGKGAAENTECSACPEKDKYIKYLEEKIELQDQKIDQLTQLVRIKEGKNTALQQQLENLHEQLRQLGGQ